MASNGPMSIVSMLSKSILATMPNVNMAIATVPENVPSENISAHTRAIISVGSVRIRASIKRHMLTITTLWLMLLDESMAMGSASAQPITVPSMDIFIVSNSGEMTFGKKLQSGCSIFLSRSSILLNLFITVSMSKPVIISERYIAAARRIIISGARLLRRSTLWPLARVMRCGLNIATGLLAYARAK